ncbi:VWA domain-containing protein [Albidovulum sediminis]|uniref:VWA domain-containing protein n=1 Tax=Albidovulum sediminis TaxID=3066345 RepID=A0ABT2NN11_9RHOB|nr:VWA domain-containing protein [Defluviimonas sediminis]MCT8328895.1 VWA domain-containing protein [Defluviimonas sediminis]
MVPGQDAKGVFPSRLLAVLLGAIAWASQASAQEPVSRVAEQAEIIAEAPGAGLGSLAFPQAVMREGAYAWLRVPKDGLYILRLSSPGSLALMSFASESGDYDSNTRPTQHALQTGFGEAPQIGPVLLNAQRKFLVGARGETSSELIVEAVEQFDRREHMPTAQAEIGAGSWLIARDGDLRLTLPPIGTPLSVEVFAEAMAPSNATLDRQPVPEGGLYPWLSSRPSELLVRSAGKGPLPSLVLVRISASDAGLDEREPNALSANPVDPSKRFRGTLLAQGDVDLLRFRVGTTAAYHVSVEGGAARASLAADLTAIDGKGTVDILHRTGRAGAVDIGTVALHPGTYELALRRHDPHPEASPYVVTFAPANAPPQGHEVEPNDSFEAANTLAGPLAVIGMGGNGDADVFSFSVPDEAAGHLWRITSRGASRLRLFDRDRAMISEHADKDGGVSLESLSLVPGEYFVEVLAENEYRLRARDLGERPEGFEGEPNDTRLTAQPLQFGVEAAGGFHRTRDTDLFMFGLNARTDVEIEIHPPGEGEIMARLFLGNRQHGGDVVFDGEAPAYLYQARLPAGEWTLQMRALEGTIWSSYRIVVRKLAAIANGEPDDSLIEAAILPMTGDISGRVGGLDQLDHVRIPLPEGEGSIAIACDGTDARLRWSVWDWRLRQGELTGGRLAAADSEWLVLPYAPDLGGSLRLQVEGGTMSADYACGVRFLPDKALENSVAEAVLAGDLSLAPGSARRFELASKEEPAVALELAPGSLAILSCRDASGGTVEFGKSGWRLRNAVTLRSTLATGLAVLRAATAPEILAGKDSNGHAAGVITCALFGVDDMRRPSETGPPAAFRPIEDETGKPIQSAPPSPGLGDLIARPAPLRQPRGSLPVAIAFSELPKLAAYVGTGQSFRTSAALRNTGSIEMTLDVTVSGTEPGWKVSSAPERVTLAPGQTAAVGIDVVAAPWQSPVTNSGLVLRASDGVDFAAEMTGVPLDPSVVPVGPMVYWDAPDALRGGLNVLHYGLGARLEFAGGRKLDPRAQDALEQVHDGIARHQTGMLVERELEFRLAAPAILAGVMIQLRSNSDSDGWPAEVILEASEDGQSWRPAAQSGLATVHVPQYVVFDVPMLASRLRVAFPRCNLPCQKAELQEIQAIAVPGTHPEGLAAIDAAGPAVGGHVIYAEPPLRGDWNRLALAPHEGDANAIWNTPDKRHTLVIGFHQNRAALLDAVAWIGHPTDRSRIEQAAVAVSVEGPGGPWRAIGTLPSPPTGMERAELRFEKPVWARYLKLTLDRPEGSRDVGPDRIEAIENPGTSVLGLWEDDQPRAAYEAATGEVDKPAHPPAGGADRQTARDLPLDIPVYSSVVMERNEDWWRIVVPDGPPSVLSLSFGAHLPDVVAELSNRNGDPIRLEATLSDGARTAVLAPGEHFLRIHEPPRSVMLSWDTSGSVSPYIPRTLAAVRTWAQSLQPGRDALNLLPFGEDEPLLQGFAESAKEVWPALRMLKPRNSSDAEHALAIAARALSQREGARGVVILTDAEAVYRPYLWPELLRTMPRVVSLSMDSDTRNNAEIMMDWAALNRGRFLRVTGPLGLADGLEMAAALFRAPKAYELTASLQEYNEPEGTATLLIDARPEFAVQPPSGAIELILDASGSMLQRIEGKRRIEVAHAALVHLVEGVLPPGVPFAFRAFGLEKDACRTELRLPLSPLDRKAAARSIRDVPAINLARTAIADSLLAAAQDLRDADEPRVIVLVTDGEETCGGDPADAIARLRAGGLDIRVNIVGFAIDDADLAQTFEAWARIGGGSYFRADGQAALEAAVAAALSPQFEITRNHADGSTEVVANGALGAQVSVPAGSLTVAPGSGAIGEAITLRLAPGGEARLSYDPMAGLSKVEGP